MTASPDDRADQPDDVTDTPVETSGDSPKSSQRAVKKAPQVKKTPTTKTAAVRTAAARKPAAATSPTKQTAAKASTVKSTAATNAAAKTSTPKNSAAKTEAAKAASARSATNKSAAKATAAKTAAAKAAAAKAAAAKAAAAKAAATKAAKAKAAAEEAEAKEASTQPTAEMTPAKSSARKTPASRPAVKKPAAKKPATKGASRPKPVVAADDAAPVSEAITSPTTPVSSELSSTPVAEASTESAIPAEESVALDEPAVEVLTPAEEPVASDAADAVATVAPAVDEPPASDAIVIRGLVKRFGDHRAVNEIDLTVRAGSFYGIVGPNGAGKTTTLSILAGLLRADAGEVAICGIDQTSDPLAAKRVMGVLPDRLRTFDRLTGRQLLHYYGLLRGLSADVIEKRTADLARAFDLVDALSRVVSDYSAGMTKKIMLAGAMIHSPRVLVLDEPFEAVDPVSSAVILDILRAYVAHGGTVILSSHGMDLVERVCSRVAIIVDGNVLAEGTIDEVRAGQTLEARFVELSGGIGEVEGLEWLHTFSD